jgi:SAM-dependent methyltransferase
VTSGITDHLPDVDGLRERWGRDVVHCPYCHGWEVRDSRITVVADNPMGAHSALLFSQWSGEVSLVAQSGAEFTDDERRRMDIRGIELVGSPAVSVAVEDDRIVGLRLADGRVHPTDVVAVPVRTVATSVVLESLGLAAVDHPMGSAMGSTFVADDTGRTAVPGVWAAGNVVSPFATVPASVAAGYQTGALINADLLDDDIAAADAPTTPSGTADGPPVMDERFWDKRYGSADRIWSGRPNPGLVAEVAELAPGRVLDIGAGEGADAIWLAERGWDVVAVDISSVALERGRRQAAIAGSEVSDRITWVHADLLATGLPSGPFDLVSSHYMQLAPDQRAALFGQYFDVVGPGGRVLIVGHHPSDMATKVGRPPRAELFYTAEDLTPDLDPAFEVLVAEARPRVVEHDGEPTTIHDTVFVARRSG